MFPLTFTPYVRARSSALASLVSAVCAASCEFPAYDLIDAQTGRAAGERSAAGAEPGGSGLGARGGQAGQASAELGGAAGDQAGGGGSGAVQPMLDCKAIRDADPDAASGPLLIDPDGSDGAEPFLAHCDMLTDGGGWTLLASMTTGAAFEAQGLANNPCYDEACTNRAYSTLAISSDFRIDGSNSAIIGDSYDVVFMVNGIDAATRGRTLHGIFTTPKPTFLDAPSGPGIVKSFRNGKDCNTWPNFGDAVCNPSLVLLQDPSACNDLVFAVGVANDYVNLKSNCDGWPQSPQMNFPQAFRFWSR